MPKSKMRNTKTGKVHTFWLIDTHGLNDEWEPVADEPESVRRVPVGPDGKGPEPIYLKNKPWLAKRKEIQTLLGTEKPPGSHVEAKEMLENAGYEVVT